MTTTETDSYNRYNLLHGTQSASNVTSHYFSISQIESTGSLLSSRLTRSPTSVNLGCPFPSCNVLELRALVVQIRSKRHEARFMVAVDLCPGRITTTLAPLVPSVMRSVRGSHVHCQHIWALPVHEWEQASWPSRFLKKHMLMHTSTHTCLTPPYSPSLISPLPNFQSGRNRYCFNRCPFLE